MYLLYHFINKYVKVGTLFWTEFALIDSEELVKLACIEYLQGLYDAALTPVDLAQLEISIWASVTPRFEPP
eukprot:3342572-Amphidinium_carterae.1